MTDITYIATLKVWLYLAAVIDIYSRQVVGWSTGSRSDIQLSLDALHMDVCVKDPATWLLCISIKAANSPAMNGSVS